MHFPGTKNDLVRRKWNDFDEMDDFYHSYLDRHLKLYDNPICVSAEDKIDSADVTVVLQGYVDINITKQAALSIRKYLPKAKIILSTWKDCELEGIDYDELILNEDPGACECGLFATEPIVNNGNRQIVSTKAGIKRVRTKYTLKMRSDLILLGDDILGYMNAFPCRKSEYEIFKQRIIIGELFTRNTFHYFDPQGVSHKVPKPFHPSDWFLFGLTEDINRMYNNIQLIPKNEMVDYTCKFPDRVLTNKYKYSWRYTTEQHILLWCVKEKFGEIYFEDWTDWSEENIKESEKIMMNNFTILSFCQHKILNCKYVASSFANSGLYYKEKGLMTNSQQVDYFRNEYR